MGNTILAKGVNHILAKRDNSAWPKGSKLSGFSTTTRRVQGKALFERAPGKVQDRPLDGNRREKSAGERKVPAMH